MNYKTKGNIKNNSHDFYVVDKEKNKENKIQWQKNIILQ